MKSTLASTALLITCLISVQAFVYPDSPIGNTVWKPNTNVTISWRDDKQAPLLSSKPVFDIFLMTGADDKQKKLATIATNVKGGTTTSVKYLVPNVDPPGQIYFLMFQTKDAKATAWATRFTITDSTGNPGNLHPVIPAGGKINPGGVGSIVSTSVKLPKSEPAKPAAADPLVSIAHTGDNSAVASLDAETEMEESNEKTVSDTVVKAHTTNSGLRSGTNMVATVAGAALVGGLYLFGL
ncbi:hypothetical protein FBU30_006626 [Linnemannia zychae]|nr:hypothetical protein FBU30_006626 [Linnemannia zychae]